MLPKKKVLARELLLRTNPFLAKARELHLLPFAAKLEVASLSNLFILEKVYL